MGREALIQKCLGLLAGGEEPAQFVLVLGGSAAMHLLANGVPADQEYWLRVWAARGLLWAGVGDDVTALRSAVSDPSWRVREMACKVVARHQIDELLDDVVALEHDANGRVRAAAKRAAQRIVRDYEDGS